MKKLFFLLVLCVCILSCKDTTGTLNPLALRTVVVENTTSTPINFHVYTVHNSSFSYTGIINSGEKKAFPNVPECNITPSGAYNWKLERSHDKSGYQTFKFRDLTINEKINVTEDVIVWNTNLSASIKLKYKIKAPGTVFETTNPISTAQAVYIKLYKDDYIKSYGVDYEFELDDAGSPPSNQEFKIIYNRAAKEINIKQMPTK